MYYPTGGAPELTQVGFDAYEPKQSHYWRYIAVVFAVVAIFGFSATLSTALASVGRADIKVPAIVAAMPPTTPQKETPIVAAAVDRSPELAAKLDAWVKVQSESEWAFYIHSLNNDELSVELGANKQFDMASIYKLFLIKPLAQKIPSEAWGSSNITEYTYLACVQAMLALSDNPCAESIAGQLGWSSVQWQLESNGYKQTVLNDESMFVSSASDTGLLLDRLYHGDGYDVKTRQITLEALGRTKRTEAFRRACSGCTVYSKTGDFGEAKHDAAIVEKDGKAYVVVMFSKNASWTQLVQAADLIKSYL
jgi:beta-lactamase class A